MIFKWFVVLTLVFISCFILLNSNDTHNATDKTGLKLLVVVFERQFALSVACIFFYATNTRTPSINSFYVYVVQLWSLSCHIHCKRIVFVCARAHVCIGYIQERNNATIQNTSNTRTLLCLYTEFDANLNMRSNTGNVKFFLFCCWLLCCVLFSVESLYDVRLCRFNAF